MKIQILLILFFSFFFTGCNNPEPKVNDFILRNLKGKVKILKEHSFDATEKFGKIIKGNALFNEELDITFNTMGNEVESNRYSKDGALDAKIITKYDSKNVIIEMIQYNSEGSPTFIDKFDKNENCIERSTYIPESGVLIWKIIYKYDNKGYMIEEGYYNDAGILTNKYIFENDEDGRKINNSWYYSDGSLISKITYIYNVNGNEIEISEYNKGGKLSENKTFSYNKFDKEGNWTKRVLFIDTKPSYIVEREIEYY